MKKVNLICLALALLCNYNPVYAQKRSSDSAFVLRYTYAMAEKKRDVKTDITTEDKRNELNVHALRNFRKNYKRIQNEQWEILEAGQIVNHEYLRNAIRYVVRFTEDSKKIMIAYDKSGGLIHTICTYDEQQLNKDIRHIIKSTYYDYRIVSVNEVNLPRVRYTIYMVNVENEARIVHLRVAEHELQLIESYDKKQ